MQVDWEGGGPEEINGCSSENNILFYFFVIVCLFSPVSNAHTVSYRGLRCACETLFIVSSVPNPKLTLSRPGRAAAMTA